MAGQVARRAANTRTATGGHRRHVGTRAAKRSERNSVRAEIAAEIAALKLVTV
jgi:hypothetical protein